MSSVTNVIFYPGTLLDREWEQDKQRLQKLDEFFTNQPGFVDMNDNSLPRGWYGGSKMLEATLLVGAFNYLDLEGLIKHIAGIEWEYPEDVQLIVKDDGDCSFRIIDVFYVVEEEKVKQAVTQLEGLGYEYCTIKGEWINEQHKRS